MCDEAATFMLFCRFMIHRVISLLLLFFTAFCSAKAQGRVTDEIIYHVFQHSFYDSNGDNNGDFNGLRQKLDYLQQLGVTSIMLTPIWQSAFYHNYFSSNFEKIDPSYGTMADYIALVKEIHRRGMKIYLDMEPQYVTEDHLWWKDSFGNPQSPYSNYILYTDKEQLHPETIVLNYTELKGYNGVVKKLTTVNLNNEAVKRYNYKLFKFWLDPDGNFDDAADGFRLDHVMDDLDGKGKLTNLLANFWKPLVDTLKAYNSKVKIIAEPGDWKSYGTEFYSRAGVDDVLAIKLAIALRTFDKDRIVRVADSTFTLVPEGKQPLVFIENHDIPRFATAVNRDIRKEKVGAALNLLIGGTPAIYYGQEIGMLGKSGHYGLTDANEVPDREAFNWYKSNAGKGMAFWYKNSGPWWDHRYNQPNDGISVEEQANDKHSLWSFYHQLINLRKNYPILITGSYLNLQNINDNVFSFLRSAGPQQMLVVINLSGSKQQVKLTCNPRDKNIRRVFGTADIKKEHNNTLGVILPGYGIAVYQLK